MNILSQVKILPEILMNTCSSVFLSSGNIITSAFSTDNILVRFFRLFAQLVYFACKWVMYMVDVIYFYIMQLAGVNIDTSIIDSAQSDTTFKLLLENKDMVTEIIKNLIVIAVILIIVTAIIAIIKLQATALKDKKAKKGPTSDVMRSVLKSVLLIIITPMIAILGIVASSVILQSLFNATNLSETKSLSGRVFNVSASAASKYRLYADNGVRIPIKYKFSPNDHDNESEVERAYNAVNYTVQMVGNEKFPSFSYFDLNTNFSNLEFQDPVLADTVIKRQQYASGTDAWRNSVYYAYYDTSDNYSTQANTIDNHRIMQTHRDEYYAMADVISYALDSMEPLYFVTIQELLESALTLNTASAQEALIKSLIESYTIRVYKNGTLIGMDANGTSATSPGDIITALRNHSYDYITYDTTYSNGTYTYTHVKDTNDEMEGAKFIIAYKVVGERTFVASINGDYYAGDSSKIAEKYFYKDSEKARYKSVDLYYYYNTDREEYVKSPTYEPDKYTYYYKMGDSFIEITPEMADKFYFKDENGDYQAMSLGQIFYADTRMYYYQPLVEGVAIGNNSVFKSEYIEPARIITARGFFDDSSYPTAMRRMSNGDLMFYRDDLELVADGSVSGFGTMDQIEAEKESEEEEEAAKDKNIFQRIGGAVKSAWNSAKKFVTDLFNPLKLVPDLTLDPSAMSTTYTNKTHSIHVLKESKLHISYFYADSFTSSLSTKMYGMSLNHIFEPLNINYVTLIIGSVIFLKVMVTAVFGLINRSLSIFILILIYPIACATIPLDEASGMAKGGAYSKWSNKYTMLLFSTYGLILGLNFVFLILPVIDGITFFTPENLQSNKAIARIATALFNPWMILPFKGLYAASFTPNYVLICNFLNWLLRIIFQIAAFSLITATGGKGKGGGDTYYSVIQTLVGKSPAGVLENSPLDAVKKVLKTAATAVNMMVFPGHAVKNLAEQSMKSAVSELKDLVPGSAILDEGKKTFEQLESQSKQDSARKALLRAIENKESKESVEAKLKEYKSTHNVKWQTLSDNELNRALFLKITLLNLKLFLICCILDTDVIHFRYDYSLFNFCNYNCHWPTE